MTLELSLKDEQTLANGAGMGNSGGETDCKQCVAAEAESSKQMAGRKREAGEASKQIKKGNL